MAEDCSPRKPWWRRWFGTQSERTAARFLKGLGYRIVARNYACSFGELDLIALDRETIVFVEVRSTNSDHPDRPAASVDDRKQKQLTKLAVHFLQKRKLLNQPARFDVLTVTWPDGQPEPTIAHYINAFEAVGRWQMFN
jgi:putative endonuclease